MKPRNQGSRFVAPEIWTQFTAGNSAASELVQRGGSFRADALVFVNVLAQLIDRGIDRLG